ncbi:MAG: DUF4189 domain-containing protein [Stenotrophomonas sp.]
MTVKYMGFMLLTLASVLPAVALAQTACPGGAVAGSRSCGPDGAPQNYRIESFTGYGAFAYSQSTGTFHSSVFNHGTTQQGTEEAALELCRRNGAQDCVLLGSWRNSCATVGTVLVDGAKHPVFASGSNTRVSRRGVRRACQAVDSAAKCTVGASECARPRSDYIAI